MSTEQTEPTCFTLHEFESFIMIRTIIAGTILIITLGIELSAIKKFIKLKKMHKTLKSLFHLSAICTIIRCICIIFGGMACICDVITLFCYFILLLSLLATLLFRLKYTFQHSSYAISTTKLTIFAILFCITSLLFIIALIMYILANIERITTTESGISFYVIITMFIAVIALIFYMITGLWAVIEFSKNLLTLTKSQANTVRDINSLKLNESQRKIIKQVSRYNALFFVAASTSIIVTIALSIAAGIALERDTDYWVISIMQCISLIDCVVNIISLYLQYSFSTKYYEKYCKCLDKCWMSIFDKYIKQSVRNQYNLPQQQIQESVPIVRDKINNGKRIATESGSEMELELETR